MLTTCNTVLDSGFCVHSTVQHAILYSTVGFVYTVLQGVLVHEHKLHTASHHVLQQGVTCILDKNIVKFDNNFLKTKPYDKKKMRVMLAY